MPTHLLLEMTDPIKVAMIASIAPTFASIVVLIVALLGRRQSKKNGEDIEKVHTMINSELEKWIKSAVAEALLKGRAEGVLYEQQRTIKEMP